MNVLIISLMFGYLSISSALPTNDVLQQNPADSIQAKRDLSLSYAATDIGSKEGIRVKTITVIKNVAGKKDKPLKIDPKLHKSENWGSHFRDNFNVYGVIPDVPDIDDLFEFVNKKEDKKPKEKNNPETEQTDEQNKKSDEDVVELNDEDEVTTTIASAPVEEVLNESKEENVEKILGDAEIIQPKGQGKVKSESLDLGKYTETMFNVNYSSPHHSVRQHFSNSALSDKKHEKYIQSPSDTYYYSQPDHNNPGSPITFPSDNSYSPQPQAGGGSVSVTIPSGKKSDVPFAPNFQTIQNSPPGQQFVTSSQRPYIAPNVRKSYQVQLKNTSAVSNNNCFPNGTSIRQQPATTVYRNIPTNIITDRFNGNRPNVPRSRGLRY